MTMVEGSMVTVRNKIIHIFSEMDDGKHFVNKVYIYISEKVFSVIVSTIDN